MLHGLLFHEEGAWHKLPDWTSFFIELGARLASFRSTQGQPIVGVTLPIRAYAAAFAATGIVLRRAPIADDQATARAYFGYLAELARRQGRVPVTVKDGRNRQVSGLLKGIRSEAGRLYLEVLAGNERSGRLTKLIPEDIAFNVQLVEQTGQPGRRRAIIRQGYKFLHRALADEDPVDFARKTRLECVILGTREQLQQEICKTSFSFINQSGKRHEGCLQDILRVHEFLAPTDPYKTQVLASTREPSPRSKSPSVVVFDGSRSFLRCRDRWRSFPWLVLLDRTEPAFDDGVSAINLEHVYRSGDAERLEIPVIPPGVEVMTFEVRN